MNERERDDSAFVGHESCPVCGSRDNAARYASGRLYCHGCQKTIEWPDDDPDNPRPARSAASRTRMTEPYDALPSDVGDEKLTRAYGISTATRRALGMGLVSMGVSHLGVDYPRKACMAFDYRLPDGTLWGQKIRYKLPEDAEDDKTFRFPHAKGSKAPPLWLMHKWTQGTDRRSLTVWEGEGDCAAYYEVTGGKYPCVSLPNGAKGAEESIRAWYDWLNQFDKIVLVFDGDATGREWAKRAAALLPPGKAFIGEVPGYKDAREALMADDPKAIQQAFWNCSQYKPDGIFRVSDLIDKARAPVNMGFPWWSPTLTKWTFGRRAGELYTLGAGNSIGKTDWTTQSIAYDALVLGIMTAVIYLEQPPVETLKRLAGKFAGKPFHIPMEALDEHERYTQEELDAALDALEASPNLIFGGDFASTEWADVEAKIRYLVISHGVKIVYLDNLTALVDETNERASVEGIIKAMALLCQELQINIILLCHLATPDGKPHEEGGNVSLKHFKGSRAMGAWPHYAFGLERNTQHSDPEMRNYSTFRCVKDRYTGRANGNTMCLRFVRETGQLVESEFPEGYTDEANSKGPRGGSPGFDAYTEEDAKALGI
ncbi:DnaB-like helicase C-terminal domain-containing protein [Sphingobium sp. CCH11-B1]|uniref:DnaB-like helicase C-terminal domain-containing protein n=1 Tax=Sphingobium sp. CCH11-B1 TaxID=1768781 RepID=UPI000833DCFF|nr:DnaB-like helicase C-terminal domain-containing protein [Sphingobium sp. CCH11-B1]